MKNFASRALALILVLSVLLMPVGALAAEHGTTTLTVGNFTLTIDDQTISLPVYLQFMGGVDLEGERGFLSASVQTATQNAITALAAVENDEVKAYLNGMSYGLTMPMEQVVTLLETAMGTSFEDLMTEMQGSVTPEMQAAINDLVAAIPALMTDSEALQAQAADLPTYFKNVLGATVEVVGEAETTTIFDVEVQAVPMTVTMENITITQLMDNVAVAAPSVKAYFDAIVKMLDQILVEAGETEVTAEAALGMISYGINGTIKQAEEGYVGEMVISMTVADGDESESIEIPYTMLYLTDEAGWYSAAVIDMNVDGENMYMTVYADDYSAEGNDFTNYEINAAIGDVGAEEPDSIVAMTFYTAGNAAEGTTYSFDAYTEDNGTPVSIGGYYHAYPAELGDEADSYTGYLSFYADDGSTSVEASMDTNLTLSPMLEGELLTFTSSINPLEADEAALEQLGTDAMTVLYQGLGILMSDPDIAALINNFAG